LRDEGCVFFFQAEDGIRDDLVTGVQTCALPIWLRRSMLVCASSWYRYSLPARRAGSPLQRSSLPRMANLTSAVLKILASASATRSEERRVGKERRARWAPDH